MNKRKYEVVDRHTGKVVKAYVTPQKARNERDRLDNIYGGYRYYVKVVSA